MHSELATDRTQTREQKGDPCQTLTALPMLLSTCPDPDGGSRHARVPKAEDHCNPYNSGRGHGHWCPTQNMERTRDVSGPVRKETEISNNCTLN